MEWATALVLIVAILSGLAAYLAPMWLPAEGRTDAIGFHVGHGPSDEIED